MKKYSIFKNKKIVTMLIVEFLLVSSTVVFLAGAAFGSTQEVETTLSFDFNFGSSKLKDVDIGDRTFSQVSALGASMISSPGSPSLPIKSVRILLPPYSELVDVNLKFGPRYQKLFKNQVEVGNTLWYSTGSTPTSVDLSSFQDVLLENIKKPNLLSRFSNLKIGSIFERLFNRLMNSTIGTVLNRLLGADGGKFDSSFNSDDVWNPGNGNIVNPDDGDSFSSPSGSVVYPGMVYAIDGDGVFNVASFSEEGEMSLFSQGAPDLSQILGGYSQSNPKGQASKQDLFSCPYMGALNFYNSLDLNYEFPAVHFVVPGAKLGMYDAVEYKHGFPVLDVNIFPTSFKSTDNGAFKLVYFKECQLEIKIVTHPNKPLNEFYRGIEADREIIRCNVVNPELVDSYPAPASYLNNYDDYDMLIITTPELKNPSQLSGSGGSTSYDNDGDKNGGSGVQGELELYTLQDLVAEHAKNGLKCRIITTDEIKGKYWGRLPSDSTILNIHPPDTYQDAFFNYGRLCGNGGADITSYKWNMAIKMCVEDEYKNNGIQYLLLVGEDTREWPSRQTNIIDDNEVATNSLKITRYKMRHDLWFLGSSDSDSASAEMDTIGNINSIPATNIDIGTMGDSGSSSNIGVLETVPPWETESTKCNGRAEDYPMTVGEWYWTESMAWDGYYGMLDKDYIMKYSDEYRAPLYFEYVLVWLIDECGNIRIPLIPLIYLEKLIFEGMSADYYSEVSVGRAPVSNAKELSTFVRKTITYMSGVPAIKNNLASGDGSSEGSVSGSLVSPYADFNDATLMGEYLGPGMGHGSSLLETTLNFSTFGFASQGIPDGTGGYNIHRLYPGLNLVESDDSSSGSSYDFGEDDDFSDQSGPIRPLQDDSPVVNVPVDVPNKGQSDIVDKPIDDTPPDVIEVPPVDGGSQESGGTSSSDEIRLPPNYVDYDFWGLDSFDYYGDSNSLPNGDYQIDATEIIDLINDGKVDILNHLGHANTAEVMGISAASMAMETPPIMYNENPGIWYSMGCLAGAYDWPGYNISFVKSGTTVMKDVKVSGVADYLTFNRGGLINYYTGEKINGVEVRKTVDQSLSGAVAFIGNSYYGWGAQAPYMSPSLKYDKEFFDAIFGEGITAIGKANDDSKEDCYARWDPFLDLWGTYSSLDGNRGLVGALSYGIMEWTHYSPNLWGDPALDIQLPSSLSVPLAVPDDGIPDNDGYDYLAGFDLLVRGSGNWKEEMRCRWDTVLEFSMNIYDFRNLFDYYSLSDNNPTSLELKFTDKLPSFRYIEGSAYLSVGDTDIYDIYEGNGWRNSVKGIINPSCPESNTIVFTFSNDPTSESYQLFLDLIDGFDDWKHMRIVFSVERATRSSLTHNVASLKGSCGSDSLNFGSESIALRLKNTYDWDYNMGD